MPSNLFPRLSIILLGVISIFCSAAVIPASKPVADDSSKANGGLKIYYLRHAEAGHNVKKYWENFKDREKPDYVGDANVFTPRGLEERDMATRRLRRLKFDLIATSPIWRARHTVLPYLETRNQNAEVWPELKETYVSHHILSDELVEPSEKILNRGDPIEIPDEELSRFSILPERDRNFKLPKFASDHSQHLEETGAARVVMNEVVKQLKKRFGGTESSVLLVGHGSSGMGILRTLVDDELKHYPSLVNAGIWMVEEQSDGSFQLKIYNDVPVNEGVKK